MVQLGQCLSSRGENRQHINGESKPQTGRQTYAANVTRTFESGRFPPQNAARLLFFDQTLTTKFRRWRSASQTECAAALRRESSTEASLSSRLVREACAISWCLSGRNIGLLTHQSIPISLALSTEQMTRRI